MRLTWTMWVEDFQFLRRLPARRSNSLGDTWRPSGSSITQGCLSSSSNPFWPLFSTLTFTGCLEVTGFLHAHRIIGKGHAQIQRLHGNQEGRAAETNFLHARHMHWRYMANPVLLTKSWEGQAAPTECKPGTDVA